jgi:hypothetical protein
MVDEAKAYTHAKDKYTLAYSNRLGEILKSLNLRTYYAPEGLLHDQPENRQIFVAYAYTLYPQDDYRRPFSELSKAFEVEFKFADERITNMHILSKVRDLIRSCSFGIYDISGWNPNVTLELGLAMRMRSESYIVFNPEKSELDEVPADIRGMDRIQYRSYSELQQRLASLLSQRMPLPKQHEIVDQISQLRKEAIKILHEHGALGIRDIARELKVPTEMAIVVKPLVDERILQMKGVKKGAKYYVAESSVKGLLSADVTLYGTRS